MIALKLSSLRALRAISAARSLSFSFGFADTPIAKRRLHSALSTTTEHIKTADSEHANACNRKHMCASRVCSADRLSLMSVHTCCTEGSKLRMLTKMGATIKLVSEQSKTEKTQACMSTNT